MSTEKVYSDDYIAALLAEDAKRLSKQYAQIGTNAFLTNKAPASKPKPNTRFLQNLVKETTSHNAALLAKEAAESKARLDRLRGGERKREGEGDIRKRQLGAIMGVLNGGKKKDEEIKREKRRRREGSEEGDDRRPSKHRSRRARKDEVDGGDDHEKDLMHSRSSTSRHSSRKERSDRHDRHVRLSRSPSPTEKQDHTRKSTRVRSPSPDRHSLRTTRTSPKNMRIKGSASREYLNHDMTGISSRGRNPPPARTSKTTHRNHEASASDSDPLDSIIGPRPPSPLKIRGRGLHSSASGIEDRFSKAYDPTADISLNHNEEADDWDQALEALRDRQKWNKSQGNRLLAAGFTPEEVAKWEAGGKKGDGEEGTGEFKWVKKGEDREWDRGKVLLGDEEPHGKAVVARSVNVRGRGA